MTSKFYLFLSFKLLRPCQAKVFFKKGFSAFFIYYGHRYFLITFYMIMANRRGLIF